MQKQIAALDLELARRGHASEQVKLLMTLPCVDVGTAQALLAAWGDFTRFPDADHAASLPGPGAFHQAIGGTLLPWPDHQARQQPCPLDADRGRAASGQAPRSLGPLLPPLDEEEDSQRGRGGGGAEAGHDRLVDAQEQRALSLRHPQEHGDQACQAAGESHRAEAQKRSAQGCEVPGQAPCGSRTIKSLAAVCQSEGLPEPRGLSRGERRTVESAGCEAYVAQIAAAQIVPAPQTTGKSAREKRNGRANAQITGSSSLLQENGHGRN